MEEYEIPHDLQAMDNMAWLDPDPGLFEALHVNNGAPFYPGPIDVVQDFYWAPSPENVDIDPLLQGMDVISESMSYGTLDVHHHELQFDNNILPDHPELEQLSVSFLAYDANDGGLTYSCCPDAESLGIGGPNSFTMSESLSPLSDLMFHSSPTSPIALLGSMQEPLQSRHPLVSICLVEPDTGSIPPRTFGNTPKVLRPREPQRRQRGPPRQVGHSRPSARAVRMEKRPEACAYCPWRFPYLADLTKHLRSKHYKELGMPKPEYHCTIDGCPHFYSRKDHLSRHMVDKHGWPKGGARSRKRAANGGTRISYTQRLT
jgi:hypothetical protein